MKKLGEILKDTRISKKITQEDVAKELRIKADVIQALEEGDWGSLPEAAYVKGFIKNYSDFLGLDSNRLLALHRAEYDERKYIQPRSKQKKRLMFTPNLIAPLTFSLAILLFVGYLAIQYTSVLSAPKLEVYSPQDDITTTAAVIEVSGKSEKETTISIDGELVPLDESGDFNYQLKLADGQNIIEIVASKRLSPKTKIKRLVRLTR